MFIKSSAVAMAAVFSLMSVAQASTVKLEVWDVLAGASTCCAPNPSIADQDNARTGGTAETLQNLADPFNASYLPLVNAIILNNPVSDAVIHVDATSLASGFAASGMVGDGSIGDTTLNDFFQTNLAVIGDNPLLGTIVRLSGQVSVTSGEDFVIRSDDGYSIVIGDAAMIENDGLQGPSNTSHTYTGTSGIQNFEMIWFDSQRTEAALKVDGLDFVQPVPLPAGLPLLLAGIGGLGFLARRKRNSN